MSTLLKPLEVRAELLRRGLLVFTSNDFQRLFHASPLRAKYFLEASTQNGLLVRLKRGLYALKEQLPPEEEIANRLYRPSYLSFEYALAAYNLLPEMVYTITSATTKPTRTFVVAERTFAYFTIRRGAFTGYMPTQRNGHTVLMAEPEKALVDYLYFVALGKKSRNERLRLDPLNRRKIWRYARLYRRAGLDKLLKEIL
jgi:predicted transcriptional regulator of viral defense system